MASFVRQDSGGPGHEDDALDGLRRAGGGGLSDAGAGKIGGEFAGLQKRGMFRGIRRQEGAVKQVWRQGEGLCAVGEGLFEGRLDVLTSGYGVTGLTLQCDEFGCLVSVECHGGSLRGAGRDQAWQDWGGVGLEVLEEGGIKAGGLAGFAVGTRVFWRANGNGGGLGGCLGFGEFVAWTDGPPYVGQTGGLNGVERQVFQRGGGEQCAAAGREIGVKHGILDPDIEPGLGVTFQAGSGRSVGLYLVGTPKGVCRQNDGFVGALAFGKGHELRKV